MPEVVVSGISSRFRGLSRCEGQIAHVLLTRSPLVYSRRSLTARLACVKHAASVRPEPGSNSPLKSLDAHQAKTRQNHRLIRVSRQDTHPTKAERATYQRNRQTDTQQPQQRSHQQPADGALQITSST